jgi:hypothetical protein
MCRFFWYTLGGFERIIEAQVGGNRHASGSAESLDKPRTLCMDVIPNDKKKKTPNQWSTWFRKRRCCAPGNFSRE